MSIVLFQKNSFILKDEYKLTPWVYVENPTRRNDVSTRFSVQISLESLYEFAQDEFPKTLYGLYYFYKRMIQNSDWSWCII